MRTVLILFTLTLVPVATIALMLRPIAPASLVGTFTYRSLASAHTLVLSGNGRYEYRTNTLGNSQSLEGEWSISNGSPGQIFLKTNGLLLTQNGAISVPFNSGYAVNRANPFGGLSLCVNDENDCFVKSAW
jgi:hypothetical protein